MAAALNFHSTTEPGGECPIHELPYLLVDLILCQYQGQVCAWSIL